jgi:hypothetical protein
MIHPLRLFLKHIDAQEVFFVTCQRKKVKFNVTYTVSVRVKCTKITILFIINCYSMVIILAFIGRYLCITINTLQVGENKQYFTVHFIYSVYFLRENPVC